MFVNVTTKSAQHAHARMIAIIVEKSPNSSHMYDHGFMDNTNRQAVCKSQKNPLSDSQTAEVVCESSQFLVSVCMAYDFNSIIL